MELTTKFRNLAGRAVLLMDERARAEAERAIEFYVKSGRRELALPVLRKKEER